MRNKDMTLDKAKESLNIALDNCQEAARNHVEQYGADERALHLIISSNNSTWGGGVLSINNIMETYIHDAAVAELGKLLRKNRVQS